MRWQTDGKCRAKIDGELSLVEAGDLLIFTPGQPYELRIDDEYNALGELTIESGDYHIFSRVPGLTRGGIPRNAQPNSGSTGRALPESVSANSAGATSCIGSLSGDFGLHGADSVPRSGPPVIRRPSTTPKTYLAYRMKITLKRMPPRCSSWRTSRPMSALVSLGQSICSKKRLAPPLCNTQWTFA